MAIEVYPLLARGVFATFGYFVIDGEAGRGVLVDPGAQPGLFLSAARERGWGVDAILLTHGHFDHMGAAGELRDAWGVPVMAHELAGRYLLDPQLNLSVGHGRAITLPGMSKLSDRDRIPVGGIAGALEVLHVPGHTDDSCAFYCEQGGFALVGDTVYEGGPGLTVFPTGDGPRLRESIRKSILTLPPDTMLLSGHSRPMTVALLAASMRSGTNRSGSPSQGELPEVDVAREPEVVVEECPGVRRRDLHHSAASRSGAFDET